MVAHTMWCQTMVVGASKVQGGKLTQITIVTELDKCETGKQKVKGRRKGVLRKVGIVGEPGDTGGCLAEGWDLKPAADSHWLLDG